MNSVTPFLPYYNNCQNIILWDFSYMLVDEHIQKAHKFFKRIDAIGKVETEFQLFFR